MEQFIPLVEAIVKRLNGDEDMLQEGMLILYELKEKDPAKICAIIDSKLRNKKQIPMLEVPERVVNNDGRYNVLCDEVLDLFEGVERDILSLMLKGFDNEEIAENLSLKKQFINLKIFYIRKKIKECLEL